MATDKKTTESSLEDFSFDEEDVFNFDNPSSTPKAKAEDGDAGNKTKKPDEDKAPPKTTKKVVEDDDDFFDDFETKKDKKEDTSTRLNKAKEVGDEDEEEDNSTDTKKKEDGKKEEKEDVLEEDDDFYTNLALDLKENEVFQNVEIPKDKKISQEEFFDLQEEEVEARVTEVFEAFVEKLDPDAKDFIKFKQKGGSTEDFMTKYLTPDFNLETFDEDNKDHVAKTIDFYLRTVEKLDGEELEDRKEYIKNGGKEKDKAKGYFTKIEKMNKEKKDSIMAALEAKTAKDAKDTEDFNTELVSAIDNVDVVGSFKITKEDKKGMDVYFTKPTVKVGKNKYIPQFHADLSKILRASSEQDKKRYIALGKIIKSGFKIEDLAQNIETQITKRTKARIRNSSPKATTAGASSRRELADMFDD